MQYHTVYDVAHGGFSTWWHSAFGLIFVFFGIVGFIFPGMFRGKTSPFYKRLFLLVYIAGSLALTAFIFTTTQRQVQYFTTMLEQGRCSIVEGKVTNFNPQPLWGKGWEIFNVGTVHFFYSRGIITDAFNQTRAWGGPIDEGVQVRIHYLGNDILRIEVAD